MYVPIQLVLTQHLSMQGLVPGAIRDTEIK